MATGGGGGSRMIGGAYVKLTLDDSGYHVSLARAKAKLEAWAKQIRQNISSVTVDPLVNNLKRISGQLAEIGVLAGGVGAAFSLKYIIDRIQEMEVSLIRLQRVSGASTTQVHELAASFFNMGTTLSGVRLDDIIELANFASRLGVEAGSLNLFTRDLARVSAVLEDIPIEEAATYFSGLIDVFGLAHTDAIRLASALNELDNSSNANAKDILNITVRLSGMASTMGLSAQQTLALATAMRQARVPIETAGTAMSQILGRMAGKDLPAFARVAGMTARQFEQLFLKDALQALVAVEQGLGRMGAVERVRALDQLHLDGQRVRLVMLQLIPILPQLAHYVGIANDEWTSMSSIMQGFKLQAETATAQFKRMWNQIQLTAIALGPFFLPILKGAADGIGNLAEDIRNFITSNQASLKAWGEWLGGIAESMGAITRLNARDVFGILKAAGEDLWGQFTRNAHVAFDNIVQLGKNAFTNMTAAWFDIVTKLLPAIAGQVIAAVGNAINKVVAMLPAAVKAMMGIPANFKAAWQANNLFPKAVPWNQGLQAMPGMQAPPVLGMIPGMMAAGAAQQRQQRVRREALGVMQDWLTRFMAGPGGKKVDPVMARMMGMAAQEDQAGMGGVGGGGGGMGAGVGGGAPQGPLGGMKAIPAARHPAVDLARMNRLALGMAALGVPGAEGVMARARHLRLLAWRERMAARRGQGRQAPPRIANPWVGIRNRLVAQRREQWMALGGAGRARADLARRDILRRTALEQRRQQEIRNQRLLGQGAPEWASSAVGEITDLLGRIERKFFPTFQ